MAPVRPDGLTHQIRYVGAERGSRLISVACAAPMPKFRVQDPLSGATVFQSMVTCADCRDNPRPWSETPDPAKKK